jgi:hypothetical protein
MWRVWKRGSEGLLRKYKMLGQRRRKDIEHGDDGGGRGLLEGLDFSFGVLAIFQQKGKRILTCRASEPALVFRRFFPGLVGFENSQAILPRVQD